MPGFCPLIVRYCSSWLVLKTRIQASARFQGHRDTVSNVPLIMINNSDVGNESSSSNILNKGNHHLDIKSKWCLDHITAVFVSQLFPSISTIFDSSVKLLPLACFWFPSYDNLSDNSVISLWSIQCLFMLFLDLLPLKSPHLHFLVFLMNEWSSSIQGFKAENLSLADRTNVFYFAISIQQDSEIPMILYLTAFK